MQREQIIETLQANRTLMEKFSVRSISIFGSAVRGESGPGSDVDILVEFEPDAEIGLFEFVDLKNSLSDLLGIPVDLATPDALHPAFKDDILRESVHVA